MTVKSTYGGETESADTMASHTDEAMIDTGSGAASSAADSQPTATTTTMQPLVPEQKERVRQVMLERLSVTGAHFAHQQRDSPDLTPQEKFNIAAEILHKNPATFLARYSGIPL